MGRVIRAYRQHPDHGSPVSQSEVAGWVDMTQPQLSRIETGRPITDLDRLVLWARLLRIPSRYLWFALPAEHSAPGPGGSSPFVWAGGDTVVLAAGAEPVRRCLTDKLSGSAPAEAVLVEWEETVARYGRATRDSPAELLVVDLLGDLVELERAVQGCGTARALRRLTRVAAQLSGLMVLAFVKLDQRQAWRQWARTARIAATEAGDPATLSWVVAQEAYGHFYAGDLAAAVEAACHAQAVAGDSGRVSAPLAASIQARAHAVLGQHHQVGDALDRAERGLDRLEATELTASAFGYNEAQLRFHEGNAYTHLGWIDAAWRAQDRALELCAPSDYTDWAMIRLDRTACLISQGDLPKAVTFATDTLSALTDRQREGIIAGRARTIVDTLAPQRSKAVSAAIGDLADLLADTHTSDHDHDETEGEGDR